MRIRMVARIRQQSGLPGGSDPPEPAAVCWAIASAVITVIGVASSSTFLGTNVPVVTTSASICSDRARATSAVTTGKETCTVTESAS